MARILLVDVGNTSVTIGMAVGRRVSRLDRLSTRSCSAEGVRRLLKKVLGNRKAVGSCLCSVVPARTRVWKRALRGFCGEDPVVVHHKLNLGVAIDYPKPTSIGGDRLANASGALARHKAPVIIADFGTALTFDLISAEGAYVGGVIAPGLPLMTEYLSQRTALLPKIQLKGACPALGRSTEGAMRIGARIGYRGIVREIVEYLESGLALGGANLVATGGFARWAMAGLDMGFSFEPDLTLRGLNRIYHLNMSDD